MAFEMVATAEAFGTLPRAGGINDQDAYLMMLMIEIIRHRAAKFAEEAEKSASGR